LLLGEVCETIHVVGFQDPPPSVVAELAAQVLAVMAEPTHELYGKVNRFLNKGPSWNAQKLLSHWTDEIMLQEPEDDNGHDVEVVWLLQLLVDGLRTPSVSFPFYCVCCPYSRDQLNQSLVPVLTVTQDMELYRKSNVFERILSLYSSPLLLSSSRQKILQIIYRSAQVGGSMTLITRAGILNWIDTNIKLGRGEEGNLEGLRLAIESGINRREVEEWKAGSKST